MGIDSSFKHYDILIVGGGAAGFFTAINVGTLDTNLKIAILEKNKEVLSKVRISGGGRCNVTHAEFIPKELSKNYPRGERELLGPFHTFMTGDTMAWFEERGVVLKIEEDGRVFPESDTSQSIIDCFMNEVEKRNIPIYYKTAVHTIYNKDSYWVLESNTTTFTCDHLVIATGSSPKMWQVLQKMDIPVTPAVPSLFTFNCPDHAILSLMGLTTQVTATIKDTKLKSTGPLLITHWGFSGPAILRLSAWGALILNKLNYSFIVVVNWLIDQRTDEVYSYLLSLKESIPKQSPYTSKVFDIPKRLWHYIVETAGIPKGFNWADISNKQLQALSATLTASEFPIEGKSTFKEEFVTAGGIDLKEVHFKTFSSKQFENLYFAGEVLNIDAITGGFNFQNAWTGGFIVAQAIASSMQE